VVAHRSLERLGLGLQGLNHGVLANRVFLERLNHGVLAGCVRLEGDDFGFQRFDGALLVSNRGFVGSHLVLQDLAAGAKLGAKGIDTFLHAACGNNSSAVAVVRLGWRRLFVTAVDGAGRAAFRRGFAVRDGALFGRDAGGDRGRLAFSVHGGRNNKFDGW